MSNKAVLIVLLLIFTSARVSLATHPILAESQTIYVDDDNITGPWDGTLQYPCMTITDALVLADESDTIYVFPGTYNESIILNRSITIQGESEFATIIDGNQTTNVVEVRADNVNIANLTIQRSAFNASGVYVYASENVSMTHVSLNDNNVGVQLYSSANCSIDSCEILDNSIGVRGSGCRQQTISNNNLSSNTAMGVYFTDSHNITIDGNTIEESEFGAGLVATHNSTLSENDISRNRYGTYIFSSTRDDVCRNNISENTDFGIWIGQSNDNIIEYNNIVGNKRFGIYCENSTWNRISKNDILENQQFGVRLDFSYNNTIIDNTLKGNHVRGALLFYSSDNTLFHNNFINNTEAASCVNSTNLLNYNFEGNYWDDYDGVDANHDGIGDTAHTIDENNEDEYPLMGTFTSSLLLYQEQTFEVQTVSNSTLSDFWFDDTLRMLQFRINAADNGGFSRITFPEQLTNSPHIVLLDNEEINTTRLEGSNITHTSLYFTFNASPHETMILPRQFFELVQTYNTLLRDFEALNYTYHQLLADYAEMATALQEAKDDFAAISTLFQALNETYQATAGNYTVLQSQHGMLEQVYDMLNQTFHESQIDYSQLLTSYDALNQSYSQISGNYTTLISRYNELLSLHRNSEAEYSTIRLALWGISGATVATIAAASILIFRYHRLAEQQKSLAETFRQQLERTDHLEAAKNQFTADINRRKQKIEDFEDKYGIAIRPRGSLDEVINNLELLRKREDKGT